VRSVAKIDNEDMPSEGRAWMQCYSSDDLQEEQMKDPITRTLIDWMNNGPPERKGVESESPALRHYWLCYEQLVMKDGVMFYKWKTGIGERVLFIVPASLRKQILDLSHKSILAAHPGLHRTVDRLRMNFYWFGMRSDVSTYISCCHECSVSKKNTKSSRASLQCYQTGAPMDRIQLDIQKMYLVHSQSLEEEASMSWCLLISVLSGLKRIHWPTKQLKQLRQQ